MKLKEAIAKNIPVITEHVTEVIFNCCVYNKSVAVYSPNNMPLLKRCYLYRLKKSEIIESKCKNVYENEEEFFSLCNHSFLKPKSYEFRTLYSSEHEISPYDFCRQRKDLDG